MNATLLAKLTHSTPKIALPLAGQASCGFPSPAADFQQPDLSLDDLVGIRPTSSIFLMRAWGDSMIDAGIGDGDVLVVDKAKTPKPGNIVVAVIGPEFVVKRLSVDGDGCVQLLADNKRYAPITLGESEAIEVWGVCIWVLHSL
jgi:DNA polymerase V